MEAERPYIRVWCEPCALRITFPNHPHTSACEAGTCAVAHANRHGATVVFTYADGHYIGEAEPQNIPTPLITSEEILDYHDLPDIVWSALAREVVRLADPWGVPL